MTKSLTTITNFYPDVQAIKYFCNTKIFKTLEYDQSLKSGQKEGVLIFQLQLVIDKKFFHHSSPANNPANSYYVNQNFFTSNINDFQIRYHVCQTCNVSIFAVFFLTASLKCFISVMQTIVYDK